jgi:hypothetical protein
MRYCSERMFPRYAYTLKMEIYYNLSLTINLLVLNYLQLNLTILFHI